MRIGICDDQKEVCELLAEKIRKLCPKGDIISYASGQELLNASKMPDILFLDIQMPGTDGMETAKRLRRCGQKMILIFVTAIEEYVFEAFDVGAFHYLVKPFTDEKFNKVFQMALCQIEDKEDENSRKEPDFLVTAKGEHIAVCMEDIVYAEVFNRKVIIHTLDSDIEYYGKMKELEKAAGDQFYRPHRAYLVNFRYIRRYDAAMIYLEKGQALIARQNYQDFVKSYLRYIRRKGTEGR